MLVDLSQMASPFFEVRVGPPGVTTNNLTLLSPEIHKLIKLFEYNEVVNGGKESASRIRLVFLEDSHQSGSILDLQFTNSGRIRSLTEAEVKKGQQREKEIKIQEEKLANLTDDSPEKKEALAKRIIELRNIQANQFPRFLFQERNIIEVTWGYHNNSKHSDLRPRTVRGEILQIRHRAPDEDIPATEILAVDLGSGELDKIYPQEAINFTVGEVKRRLGDKNINVTTNLFTGEALPDDHPASVIDIVNTLAKGGFLKNTKAAIDLTEEELKLDQQDRNSARVWSLGTSMHDFLGELAEKIFAHYYINTIGPKNTTVLNFVSRRKFESSGRFHFLWKSGLNERGIETNNKDVLYNTVKNYDLALYPNGGDGASSTGVCSSTKKPVGSIAGASVVFSPRHSELKELEIKLNEEIKTQALKPDSSDPKNAESNQSTGISVYSDNCGANDHEANADRLAGRMERNLKLEFTSIGIPQLTPTTIKMSNIGLRYSGIYYLLSVNHKITDSEGYICSCVGESNSVASGGSNVEGSPVRLDLATNPCIIRFLGDPSKSLIQQLEDCTNKAKGK